MESWPFTRTCSTCRTSRSWKTGPLPVHAAPVGPVVHGKLALYPYMQQLSDQSFRVSLPFTRTCSTCRTSRSRKTGPLPVHVAPVGPVVHGKLALYPYMQHLSDQSFMESWPFTRTCSTCRTSRSWKAGPLPVHAAPVGPVVHGKLALYPYMQHLWDQSFMESWPFTRTCSTCRTSRSRKTGPLPVHAAPVGPVVQGKLALYPYMQHLSDQSFMENWPFTRSCSTCRTSRSRKAGPLPVHAAPVGPDVQGKLALYPYMQHLSDQSFTESWPFTRTCSTCRTSRLRKAGPLPVHVAPVGPVVHGKLAFTRTCSTCRTSRSWKAGPLPVHAAPVGLVVQGKLALYPYMQHLSDQTFKESWPFTRTCSTCRTSRSRKAGPLPVHAAPVGPVVYGKLALYPYM
ncbi:uncharacterized protein LOC128220125 [Mya arenaria]|uniref:uncharacterized protein LOC128220125 n=1 Tax=Mya arenaria TaxID=6604 RepID=UPI0022E66C7B|nr:uncharacterized protein LOC128220125 [Mya arenaria]